MMENANNKIRIEYTQDQLEDLVEILLESSHLADEEIEETVRDFRLTEQQQKYRLRAIQRKIDIIDNTISKLAPYSEQIVDIEDVL